MQRRKQQAKELARRLAKVLWDTVRSWREDHADRLAAALSFYAIFSLAPSLIIVISLTGLVIDQTRVESEIILQVQRVMGTDASQFIEQVLANRAAANPNRNRFTTLLGVATILFGASGAFSQLQGALNSIWRVRAKPKRGWLNVIRTRLFAFVILLLIGFMLMVSFVVNTWLILIDGWFSAVMPELHLLFNVGNTIFSFAISMLLFALLYKIMPDVTIRWHDIWAGAAVTAILFNFGKWGLGVYLSSSVIARNFGAAGALVALLVWVYFSSAVTMFGAEFIKVFALQRGRAVLPASHAVTFKWTREDATVID